MSSQAATYLQQQENLRNARRTNLERMSKGLAPLPLENKGAASMTDREDELRAENGYAPRIPDLTRGNKTVLHRAAEAGDVGLLKSGLQGGAYIDAKDRAGLTALMVAIKNENTDAVRALLENGADTAAAVSWAAASDSMDILLLLLEAGTDTQWETELNGALATAAYSCKSEFVDILLNHGADADAVDQHGVGILSGVVFQYGYKADGGMLLIMKQLIHAGADVNQLYCGRPLVQIAVERYLGDVTQLLVESGAYVNFPVKGYDQEYRSLLLFATCLISGTADSETWNIVCCLARAGLKLEKENSKVLISAAEAGREDVVRLLVSLGADIEISRAILPHWPEETAIMRAAECGHADIVWLLAKAGAKLDLRGPVKDQTALMRAADQGHTKVIRALGRAGAMLDLRDEDAETALMLAA